MHTLMPKRLGARQNQPSRSSVLSPFGGRFALATLIVGVLAWSLPAAAHHPFGEETPASFVQGFLSGLGHPVIGVDHLAFTIATGLLAALASRGLSIPIAFAIGGLVGTGIHLANVDLPAVELAVSASVLLIGVAIAAKERPGALALAAVAAAAGVFHGYAYGEAIVGAELMPMVSYLLGFTAIQLAIALAAFAIGKVVMGRNVEQPTLALRFVGFAVCGAGMAFLSSAVLG